MELILPLALGVMNVGNPRLVLVPLFHVEVKGIDALVAFKRLLVLESPCTVVTDDTEMPMDVASEELVALTIVDERGVELVAVDVPKSSEFETAMLVLLIGQRVEKVGIGLVIKELLVVRVPIVGDSELVPAPEVMGKALETSVVGKVRDVLVGAVIHVLVLPLKEAEVRDKDDS